MNPRLRPWQGRTLPLSYSRSVLSSYSTCAFVNKSRGWLPFPPTDKRKTAIPSACSVKKSRRQLAPPGTPLFLYCQRGLDEALVRRIRWVSRQRRSSNVFLGDCAAQPWLISLQPGRRKDKVIPVGRAISPARRPALPGTPFFMGLFWGALRHSVRLNRYRITRL